MPDLIIGDFFSIYPTIIADELEIPIVVNCPTPLEMLANRIVPTIKESKHTCSCCGCLCLLPNMMYAGQ